MLWALWHLGTGVVEGPFSAHLRELKVPEAAVLREPLRDSGETQMPARHSGGTVLGVFLGFALAPGRAPHSQELRPGDWCALEEGDANSEARPSVYPIYRVADQMGGSGVLRQQRPAFATSHRHSLEGFGPGC